MQTLKIALGIVALLAALSVSAQAPRAIRSVVEPGAKLEKISSDYEFTEGPASNARGDVYFTDQPNDRILKWSVDGKITTFLKPCGRSNGLCFDSNGNLWACA